MKINNKKIFCSSSPLKKGIIGEFSAFTLIEIMIGILISSFIIIAGFKAFNAVLIGKIKLIESTTIEKESFNFSQKLFEEIKKGGLIDYEEYFNRKVVNMGGSDLYSSGHYLKETGFGNEGIGKDGDTNSFYHCRSGNGIGNKIIGNGCLNINLNNSGKNQLGKRQRYGQYSFQFIDYNSNYDSDGGLLGDENGDGNIIGDDDDLHLGKGPEVFNSGTGITELYLLSADKKRRTLFRWSIKKDPDSPNGKNCDFSNPKKPIGEGCLGTIEFLKLDGKDWGFDHNITTGSKFGEFDGIIDTWLINNDFSKTKNGNIDVVAGSDLVNYWIPLFPNSINVKSFDLRAYPNKDLNLAWAEGGIDLSPYVRINMVLTPSWKTKRKIKGKIPEFNISTTINLTDIFSR